MAGLFGYPALPPRFPSGGSLREQWTWAESTERYWHSLNLYAQSYFGLAHRPEPEPESRIEDMKFDPTAIDREDDMKFDPTAIDREGDMKFDPIDRSRSPPRSSCCPEPPGRRSPTPTSDHEDDMKFDPTAIDRSRSPPRRSSFPEQARRRSPTPSPPTPTSVCRATRSTPSPEVLVDMRALSPERSATNKFLLRWLALAEDEGDKLDELVTLWDQDSARERAETNMRAMMDVGADYVDMALRNSTSMEARSSFPAGLQTMLKETQAYVGPKSIMF
jgi:hypothetical protein